MFKNTRKALFVVLAGSLLVSTAQAGHGTNMLKSAMSRAKQFSQQTSPSSGGRMQGFRQAVSQKAAQFQSSQPTSGTAPQGLRAKLAGKVAQFRAAGNPQQNLIQGFNQTSQAAENRFGVGFDPTGTTPANPTNKPADTILLPYFEVDLDKQSKTGPLFEVNNVPATTPAPTPQGGMGGNRGSWLPAVVGAIGAVAEARANAAYSQPVYSQPMYQAPVYEAPVPQYTQAPVQAPQYAPAPQYNAQAPQYAPAPVAAPATTGLVIYAVESLEGQSGQLLVRGNGFGTQAGQLVMEVNGVRMALTSTTWTPNAIVVNMPAIQVAPGSTASFTAIRVDGAASQPFTPGTAATVASR